VVCKYEKIKPQSTSLCYRKPKENNFNRFLIQKLNKSK